MKFKARAGARFWIPFLNGVVEAACCTNDRYCPVFEAVNLVQTAGLITRWHEIDVRTGLDLVCQRFVIGNADGNLIRESVMQGTKEIFVILFTSAEHNQKDILESKTFDNLRGEVKAFLGSETGENTEHGGIFIHMGSPESMKQVALAFRFAAQIPGGIMCSDFAVGFRIPFGIIHSVQDAVKVC